MKILKNLQEQRTHISFGLLFLASNYFYFLRNENFPVDVVGAIAAALISAAVTKLIVEVLNEQKIKSWQLGLLHSLLGVGLSALISWMMFPEVTQWLNIYHYFFFLSHGAFFTIYFEPKQTQELHWSDSLQATIGIMLFELTTKNPLSGVQDFLKFHSLLGVFIVATLAAAFSLKILHFSAHIKRLFVLSFYLISILTLIQAYK